MTQGAQLLKLTKKEKEEEAARKAGSSGGDRLLKAASSYRGRRVADCKEKKKNTHTHHTHTEGKSCLFPSQVSDSRIDFSYLSGESEGQRVGRASGDGGGGWRGCEMYAVRRVNLFHMTGLGAVFVNCTLERAKRSQVV